MFAQFVFRLFLVVTLFAVVTPDFADSAPKKTYKEEPCTPENVNTRDQYGNTRLIIAVMNGTLEEVRKILQIEGVDVNACALDSKDSPLHIAVKKGNLEITEALLAKSEICLNSQNNDLKKPIYYAVSHNYDEILKELIEKINQAPDIDLKKEINEKDAEGNTLLHIAAKKGYTSAVTQLLAIGVNTTIVNNAGKTASDIARDNGYNQTADIIDCYEGTKTIS